jgi:predicted transcriptional regulator
MSHFGCLRRVETIRTIALRFDPETKRRLEDMAEGIGPRRFGALIRVACRRLVTQPKAVGNGLDEQRRLSEALRAIPLLMLKIKLEPDTARQFAALAAEHDTTVSALMRIALHRFLEAPGRYKHPMLREAERTGLSDWVDVMVNPSSKQQVWRLAGRYGDKLNTACSESPYDTYSTSLATSPRTSKPSHHCATSDPKSIQPGRMCTSTHHYATNSTHWQNRSAPIAPS